MASEIENLNNGETHGYAWSDGTTRSYPEYSIPGPGAKPVRMSDSEIEKREGPKHVTQATLDKAYADWLKEYTRWKAAFAEWEAKYGKR